MSCGHVGYPWNQYSEHSEASKRSVSILLGKCAEVLPIGAECVQGHLEIWVGG